MKHKFENVTIRLVSDTPLYSSKPIRSTRDAIDLVGKMMSELDRESICIINLNAASKPINMSIVSVGGVKSVYCEPASVFKSALLSNASYIIMLHNHPSGEAVPSREDISLTNRMIDAGELLGIPVLDHIVVGRWREDEKSYHSMEEHKTCNFKLPSYLFAGEKQHHKRVQTR